MKRILAVILTLALLFAGCRKGTDRKQENNNKLEKSVGELTDGDPVERADGEEHRHRRKTCDSGL